MNNLTLKQKIIAIIAIIGSLLILIFQRGLYSKDVSVINNPVKQTAQEVKITSTNPSPLEDATILPTQNIEVTFSQPLQNKDELKHKLEPKLSYQINLSEDKKTAKFIPTANWQLGIRYTLFIYADTKFEAEFKLTQEEIFHFKTIDYQGV